MNGQASCRKSCEPYNFAKPKSCYKDLFCAKQPGCNGRLFDCGFYDADAWVCLSQNPERKYDWIEYEDGTRLGRKGQCANKIKVDSWWRWLFWHCSYCFCKCDAPGPNSDRYWSLKPALVDVSANKILTGLRFVKKNRIIQVEVQQSSPLPEGVINETDRSWIQNSPELTLDALNHESHHVYNDIFEMSYEERSLDLDVLEAPKGHVVTGVRFRKLGSHINLEARVKEYFPIFIALYDCFQFRSLQLILKLEYSMHHYQFGLVTTKRNLAKKTGGLVLASSHQTFLRDI